MTFKYKVVVVTGDAAVAVRDAVHLLDRPDAFQNSRDASRGDILEYLSIVVERVEVHDGRGEPASVRLKPRKRLVAGDGRTQILVAQLRRAA